MDAADTREFARSLVRALGNSFFDGARLNESRFRAAAPTTHYAATCFAVAAFRAFDLTGDRRCYERGARILSHYLDLSDDRRGHPEFNALALLTAVEDARNGRYDLPVSESTLTEQIEYSSSVHTTDGNNWLLLQALCRTLRAELFDGGAQRRRAIRRFAFSRRWHLDDGVIADYPRHPVPPIETPLTYHAKSTMLTVRLENRLGGSPPGIDPSANCRALARATLPNGQALYFGRSDDTLFGYACAIDALARLDAQRDGTPGWCERARARLVSFLLEQFDPGAVRCQPKGLADGERLDEYVYDAVYAAYAAMILLGLPALSPDGTDADATGPEIDRLPAAGLLAARGRDSGLGTATIGQVRRRDGRPDARYAGMTPLSFVHGNRWVCPGVPIDDSSVPYLPIVDHEGRRYAPFTWESRASESDGTLHVVGTGQFHRIDDPSGTGSDESLVERGKTALKRDDRTRRVARAGYGFADRLARASRLDLAARHLRSRATPLPVRTRRAIRFLLQDDVLVIQTLTSSMEGEDVAIRPSSVVVTPAYEDRTELAYRSDPDVARRDTVTHRAAARRLVPARCRSSAPTWSVALFDPADRVRRVDTTFDAGAVVTSIDTESGAERVRLALDSDPSRETIQEGPARTTVT